MSQHSQRTQFGPSGASIAAGAAVVLGSAVATGYMISGLSVSLRDLMGFALGVGFTAVLAYHVLVMAGERAVARDRELRLSAERKAAQRARQEAAGRADAGELEAWRNATVGLLDAYLTGRALDFRGEVVPEYVQARLADLGGPPVDEGPVIYPQHPIMDMRNWLANPDVPGLKIPQEVITGQATQPPEAWVDPDPVGYVADPERPWRAFEAREATVAVPLPARDGYVDPGPFQGFVPVSPGRVDPDATAVIERVVDEDATHVIARVSHDATEEISRVR